MLVHTRTRSAAGGRDGDHAGAAKEAAAAAKKREEERAKAGELIRVKTKELNARKKKM